MSNHITKVFNDNFLTITWLEDEKLMEINWSEQCNNLLDEVYKERFSSIEKYVTKYQPSNLLINLRGCNYFVNPENYQWYEKTMFSIIKPQQLTKTAIVIPQNLFVHASFEATRIQFEKDKVPVQYFIDAEKAKYWLMNGE